MTAGGGAPDAHADPALAEAARRVLAGDGRQFILQPWQIAYCFALVEGREPMVPPGCGVGKGWLDARLHEALTPRVPARAPERNGLPNGPRRQGC